MPHLVNIRDVKHSSRNKRLASGQAQPKNQQANDYTLIILFYKEIYNTGFLRM